jgi:hypothetical protein
MDGVFQYVPRGGLAEWHGVQVSAITCGELLYAINTGTCNLLTLGGWTAVACKCALS